MRIKVLFNKRKTWASKLARKIRTHLRKRGFELVKKDASSTVVIGGDGTLLYYGFKGELEGAVLGIGSASSRICQLKRGHWAKEIDEILTTSKTKAWFTLNIGIGKKKYRAINDVVLHTTNYRVIDIIVNINGKKYFFRGDGILLSTAVGSSGYAYSAGAKMLKPNSKKMIIAPICPYMRAFSPMIVDHKTIITIKSKNLAAVIIDGMFLKNIKGKSISVKQGLAWHPLVKK